jgi:carboxylesterase type B
MKELPVSDVSALMGKLKATVSYKQFDAPPASEQAWPILEKMARAKSALAQPAPQVMAASVQDQIAPVTPVAAPASAPARTADVLVSVTASEGSLFERLQADAAPAKSAAFSRYGAAEAAEAEPQALSEIFERIARKAL